MEKELNIIRMGKYNMKVILLMIIMKEMGNMFGKMVRNMQGNLRMVKLRVKEHFYMKMDQYSEVILLMDIKMAKALLNFLMEKNIQEIG